MPQEPHNQNTDKLSYTLPLHANLNDLLHEIEELLDGLPRNTAKLHAIQFVREHMGFPLPENVFSADSGNNMPVQVSEIHGTQVANAIRYIHDQAK